MTENLDHYLRLWLIRFNKNYPVLSETSPLGPSPT